MKQTTYRFSESLLWVLAVSPDMLPDAPFKLDYCSTVTDRERWLEKLQEDVRLVISGDSCPRAKTGALHSDIDNLQALLDREEF